VVARSLAGRGWWGSLDLCDQYPCGDSVELAELAASEASVRSRPCRPRS
jgi:hypothetical protein